MTIRLRTAFFIILGLLFVCFLFIERGILRPFIIAGIFAYIFNPTVNFFSEKIKLPRIVSIVIIYALLIGLFVGLGILLTQRITAEADDIRSYANQLLYTANAQLYTLPDWLKPTVNDLLYTVRRGTFFTPTSIVPFFPQAVSRVVSFIIFIFSAFYLLKDGEMGIKRTMSFVPKYYRSDVKMLLDKINAVLGGYLRGQVFLVFLMSVFTFIALSIIGVRFALVIGIFSGFAEIVPVIGPIIAATVAIIVVLVTGTANFGLTSINAAIIVAVTYFVLRHLEDYFVIPEVMGKITKLPPFIIFFAVIAGGHLWGVLGLILAVPIAAIIKILLEYSFEQINRRHYSKVPGSE
ncbi:MAG TPA: AI-2E family transporter [Candidatus Saccharimonadales bacterium]|nr:AI-2E family transporter [Candidatus Saccharimonadales bacterium]